jgi:hypothetical protein
MSNPNRTQVIKRFLEASTHADLASLYNHDMECQVNVGQDGGERVDGEYKGRKWQAWTDGIQTWKSFRIPRNANTNPEFQDSELGYDISIHAEAIGMTGWNWKSKVSKWVAYDFDSMINHAKTGLSNEELQTIQNTVASVPWVTLRKSTSGKGLHLYVSVDDVLTANHNEHAALARAILGKLSALTGYDFSTKVDICGGNMWVWHRKMLGTDGLSLVKSGSRLEEIPVNWKDHIKVVSGRRAKIRPDFVQPDQIDVFEELTTSRPKTPLDEEHKKLIKYLQDNDCQWWWDQDHHMLVTHTIHLRDAHESLSLKGIFKTLSVGKEIGHDHNCYLFPLRRGSWVVRRYHQGVSEAETWDQDSQGFTRCYFNREPDLATVSRSYGGVEHPSGGFVFREAENAVKASLALGTNINVPPSLASRAAKLKQHKDGRLIFEITEAKAGDNIDGWLAEKGTLKKIFNTNSIAPAEPETANYDDLVRHLITETGDDYGWTIKTDGKWNNEPLLHIKSALKSLGQSPKDIDIIVGSSVFKCWKLVNKPFQPEYPGNREWNRNAAQFRFLPKENRDNLNYPTWKKLLSHIGHGLDDAISGNGWCIANGILTGADYLKCWIASLFQSPLEPLPYLFLYGPQNSGKSIFHESVALLVTKGVKRADSALISQSGFNGELEDAILCVVEETNISKERNQAYNRIKDWVTARHIPIHQKGRTPYSIPNSTHWVQTANDYSACPIFPGDTRITMIYVDSLDPTEMIPKRELIPLLEKEAADFLSEILNLEIPPSNDRLGVPVITTDDKKVTEELNQTALQRFVKETTYYVEGKMIKISEFCNRFHEWLDVSDIPKWSKIRIGREMPPQFPKGRNMQDGAQYYYGNISWTDKNPKEPVLPKLIAVNDRLVPKAEK